MYLLSRNISTLLITVRAPKLCQKHDMLKNTTLPLYGRHKELIMSDFVLYIIVFQHWACTGWASNYRRNHPLEQSWPTFFSSSQCALFVSREGPGVEFKAHFIFLHAQSLLECKFWKHLEQCRLDSLTHLHVIFYQMRDFSIRPALQKSIYQAKRKWPIEQN